MNIKNMNTNYFFFNSGIYYKPKTLIFLISVLNFRAQTISVKFGGDFVTF